MLDVLASNCMSGNEWLNVFSSLMKVQAGLLKERRWAFLAISACDVGLGDGWQTMQVTETITGRSWEIARGAMVISRDWKLDSSGGCAFPQRMSSDFALR